MARTHELNDTSKLTIVRMMIAVEWGLKGPEAFIENHVLARATDGSEVFDEVQSRQQLFEALGLPQVGRQNLGGKWFRSVIRSAVVHPGLTHLHRPDARGDRSPWQVAVADHLAMATRVFEVAATCLR
jgi:hypothetical protein